MISKEEVKKQVGLSSVANDEAEKVRSHCEIPIQWLLISSLLSVHFLTIHTKFLIERYPNSYYDLLVF